MSEEKDGSSVAGVQAGPVGPTYTPRSDGRVPPTGYVMLPTGMYCKCPRLWRQSMSELWCCNAGKAPSSEEQCISPSEASAGTQATDDQKYSISPSPLPEGQDLAELKRVAEECAGWIERGAPNVLITARQVEVLSECVPALLHRVETAERELERRDAVAKAAWGDQQDEHSAAISAAHPMRTRDHETFGRALEMVGTRYGKYELVALVNWLLGRAEKAEAQLARARGALGRIKDDYCVNHTSKWCRDFASEVFTSLGEKGEEDKGSSVAESAAREAARPDGPHSAGWERAARELARTFADERDYTLKLRAELTSAREYVTDALDAHEHSDGRELLQRIDALLSSGEG